SRLNAAERCLLAQHLPEEVSAMARHQRELWELLPPNLDLEDTRFETALRGRALTPGEEAGLELERAKRGREMGITRPGAAGAAESLAAPAAAAAPMPAPAPATSATMDGANTYTGSTTVTAGALEVQTQTADRSMGFARAATAGNRSGNVVMSENAIDALL